MSYTQKIESETKKYGYKLSWHPEKVNSHTKVTIECPAGHVYDVRASSFVYGVRCRKCSKRKDSDRRIKKHANTFYEALVKEGYKLIEEGSYVKAIHPVKVMCPKKHIYDTIPSNFMSGHRCQKCEMHKRTRGMAEKNYIEILKLVKESGFEIVGGNYENENSRITFKCNEGHVYESDARCFKWGHRCPECNLSRGEEAIRDFLSKENIKHEPQKSFKECKIIRPLPFDFAVYENDEIKLLIEYEGEQHFEPLEHFGGEKRFKFTQKSDKTKRDFCKKNKIPLLEIPYWEKENINKILTHELSQLLTK